MLVALIVYVAISFRNISVDSGKTPLSPDITDFDSCAASGLPVQESYPEACIAPDGTRHVRDIGNEIEKSDLIRIDTPRPNDTVSSPLAVSGSARGSWFFEGSFPLRVEDENGNTIGAGYAQAKGEWMTEGFVDFSATVEFSATPRTKGRLILEKDNPSGLAERDNSLTVPVTFGTQAGTVSVLIYFPNDTKNGTTDCSVVYPVFRSIAKTQAPARAALEQLIAGPISEEEKNGYGSLIPKNTAIEGLAIDSEGIARVNFSKELTIAGSCSVSAVRSQIEQTLLQFPTVKSVEIRVDGSKDTALQP